MADWMESAALAESYDARAADCYRNAREARDRRKAAYEAGDMEEWERQTILAREWGNQGAQLRRDARALRAGPAVGQGPKKRGAAPMGKW